MSGKFVVDTNVPVAANGRGTHADAPCQAACIEAILNIRSDGTVVIDDQDLIFEEYAKNLERRGEPGVGDAFFKHIYNYMYSDSKRVLRVPINIVNDDKRGFDNLPQNKLDPDDRKFLAVAVRTKTPILNATDSDWHEQRKLLRSLSITVKQLCPQHAKSRPNKATGVRKTP